MAPSAKPAWAEYEALAHEIVQVLAPLAEVTHDDHILGTESETKRQIDISVKWKDGDIENLLIIQVKDYKRKADLITVGEFRSVIQDVGAQKGILICSGGFSKSALTYARNTGLLLWSLGDARSKKWSLELTVPVLWNKLVPTLHTPWRFQTNSHPLDIVASKSKGLKLWTDGGESPFDLIALFESRWTAGELSFDTDVEHALPVPDQLYIEGIRPDGTSEKLPLLDNTVNYTVKRESHLAQLSPIDYRGIVDHMDDKSFIPSEMTMEMPPLNDGVWIPVRNPSRIAVGIRGTFFSIDDIGISNPTFSADIENIG